MYSRITGTGKYLPERILTNFDLEKMVDTTDEWIRTRTGIEHRHIAADDEATSDLAYHAGLAALEDAGSRPPTSISCSSAPRRPDLVFPNVGCSVQEKLGIRGCAGVQSRSGMLRVSSTRSSSPTNSFAAVRCGVRS